MIAEFLGVAMKKVGNTYKALPVVSNHGIET